MRSCFPDTNVWLALAARKHQHHSIAVAWFDGIESTKVYFCRFTQIAFLRLVTHATVMGQEAKTQIEAWKAYDLLLADERVYFNSEPEPDELERELRKLTSKAQCSSKDWPDAYLAAFARAAGLTLITFDRALYKLAEPDAKMLFTQA